MKKVMLTFVSVLFSLSAHAVALSDGHITEIMKEANEAEIDAGQLAKRKAQNSDVKAYAERMISAHKDNEKAVKSVAKQQKIDMDDNEISEKLEKDAKNKLSDLKKKDKGEFDRAYIAAQIEMHQTLLADIENTYLPAAKNAELKKYLEDTKAHVATHLEEAKNIQTSLQ